MSKRVLESTGLALTADSRVDQETGLITGCKVIGTTSKNKRHYPPALLAERFAVYEGAQVYVDHNYAQLKSGRARPMNEWGGVLRGVTARPDGVYGNLQCLKDTNAGRIILGAAVSCQDKFGLSPMHLIDTTKNPDGSETVTAILECYSVDAVTRPATTRTLFESEEVTMPDEPAVTPAAPAPPSIEDAFLILQNAIMADGDLEDTERLQVLRDVMKLKSKVLGGGEEEPAEETPAEESHTVTPPIGRTAARLDRIEQGLRAMTIRQLAGESLPLDAPTMAALLALPDDAAVAVQIEALRRQRRPKYSSGPARSTGRTVAAESQGSRPAAVPRLTAGADREQVKAYYRK